jgi:hypothetical protein
LKIVYAVEASILIEEVPEFDLLLRNETSLKDTAGTIYLYESEQDRETAVFLLKEGHLLEDRHLLISLENAIMWEHFNDCGTISENGEYYLWLELVLPFTVTAGDLIQQEMALLQFEEHLAASASLACGRVYFIGVHLKELASGIARAYDIEVSFLDLDKLGI